MGELVYSSFLSARKIFVILLYSCSTFRVTTPTKPAQLSSQTEEVDLGEVELSAEGELTPSP